MLYCRKSYDHEEKMRQYFQPSLILVCLSLLWCCSTSTEAIIVLKHSGHERVNIDCMTETNVTGAEEIAIPLSNNRSQHSCQCLWQLRSSSLSPDDNTYAVKIKLNSATKDLVSGADWYYPGKAFAFVVRSDGPSSSSVAFLLDSTRSDGWVAPIKNRGKGFSLKETPHIHDKDDFLLTCSPEEWLAVYKNEQYLIIREGQLPPKSLESQAPMDGGAAHLVVLFVAVIIIMVLVAAILICKKVKGGRYHEKSKSYDSAYGPVVSFEEDKVEERAQNLANLASLEEGKVEEGTHNLVTCP